jgi:poly(beta-D-mannuronate) lyase
VIGDDHIIINNYIEGVSQGGIWITAGIEDSPLKGYFRARNALIAFNTMVDSRGPAMDLSAGLGSAGRTLLPENITIANNLFQIPENGSLLKGTEESNFSWLGNMVQLSTPETNHPGVRRADPILQRAKDGLLRPAANSPIRGAAHGKFPAIKNDMDGQPRRRRLDVGADQISSDPSKNRPLTPKDVGPSWLETPGAS